jgi:hypothetical protein
MNISNLSYKQKDGWSSDFPLELDSDETLILVFGARFFLEDYSQIEYLRESFSNSKIVGCSTSGEIFGDTVNDKSLAVSIVKFEKTRLQTAFSPISDSDESFSAGEEIARILNKPDLKGILILSDGLNVNGTELVAGLKSQTYENVVITGGLAGDSVKFEKTWVLTNGTPSEGYVSAVGFYGESVKIGHGSKDGLDFFGIEREVTKSAKNVLFELDGQPALELYKKYLGEEAAGLPASALFFPLALRTDYGQEKRIVRTILSVDEENQSMTFAGDVPQGSFVQLMRANVDRIIDGASGAAVDSMENFSEDEEVLSIAISCVGRRLVLGERAEEELEAVLENLPKKTKQIGFYSYGEISPSEKGSCDLHNQTMTLTTISEK